MSISSTIPIQQAVWQAADTLMADGIRPTVANVRELTQRGSAGTINDALKGWWQDLAQRIRREQVQPDLPAALITSFKHIWDEALIHAEQAYAELKASAQVEIQTADQARQLAVQAQQDAENLLQGTRQELQQLVVSERDLQNRLAAETALRQQLEHQAEQYKQESQKALSEAETARGQLETELALLAAQYQHSEQQAQQQYDQLQHLFSSLQQDFDQQKQRWQQQIESGENRATTAELLLLQEQAENRLLRQQLESAQRENGQLTLELQRPLARRGAATRARLKRF